MSHAGTHDRATIVRWQRAAWCCAGLSAVLLPPAYALGGAVLYVMAKSPTHLPPAGLLILTVAVFVVGLGALIVGETAKGHVQQLARQRLEARR